MVGCLNARDFARRKQTRWIDVGSIRCQEIRRVLEGRGASPTALHPALERSGVVALKIGTARSRGRQKPLAIVHRVVKYPKLPAFEDRTELELGVLDRPGSLGLLFNLLPFEHKGRVRG